MSSSVCMCYSNTYGGNGAADAKATEEAGDGKENDVGRDGRDEAEDDVESECGHSDGLAADAIGRGTGHEAAQEHAGKQGSRNDTCAKRCVRFGCAERMNGGRARCG